MSGTFAAKVLAEGQVPSSKTTIYTCPGSTQAYVYNLMVTNVSGGTSETVVLYFKRATSREINRVVLTTTGWRAELFDKVFHLEAGDKLEMQTSNATSVDFVLTGVLES